MRFLRALWALPLAAALLASPAAAAHYIQEGTVDPVNGLADISFNTWSSDFDPLRPFHVTLFLPDGTITTAEFERTLQFEIRAANGDVLSTYDIDAGCDGVGCVAYAGGLIATNVNDRPDGGFDWGLQTFPIGTNFPPGSVWVGDIISAKVLVASNDPVKFRYVLSALPEPGTWAMMIIGFGLAGAALRKRATAPLPAA